MNPLFRSFASEISERLAKIDELAATGGLDAAINIMADALANGGVLQAFGTGHSEAFAMEVAGRAGGFIPSHAPALVDLVVLGGRPASLLNSSEFERDPSVASELYDLFDVRPQDAFLIASNSGANGSTVGLALRAKEKGHKVIAVTSLEHTHLVTSNHPSGKRLFEVADVVIDNLAPFGDATLPLIDGLKIGPVSSITAAYIAQLLTIGTADRLRQTGCLPPMFISANVPGGDEHNTALQQKFGARISPYAYLDNAAAQSQ